MTATPSLGRRLVFSGTQIPRGPSRVIGIKLLKVKVVKILISTLGEICRLDLLHLQHLTSNGKGQGIYLPLFLKDYIVQTWLSQILDGKINSNR